MTLDLACPPDGGFLVLNDAQLGNLDLLCRIKTYYPRTRIIAQRAVSRATLCVMAIGNPPAGPSGMVGYFARQGDLTLRDIRRGMDKLKASTF